jgi:hypothetical protein
MVVDVADAPGGCMLHNRNKKPRFVFELRRHVIKEGSVLEVKCLK